MHNGFLAGTCRWQPWSRITERSIVHSYRTDDVHWKPLPHQPDDLTHVYRRLYETNPTDLMNITEKFHHTNLTNLILWPTPLEALSHQPCILDVHNWKHVTPVLQMWWCTLLTALSHQPYRVDDVMHTAKSLSHRSYRCDDTVHNTDSSITPILQTGWCDAHR